MLSTSASTSSRLLKKVSNFVLGSSKSSTYPRGYASGFDSPAALLATFLSSLNCFVVLFQKLFPHWPFPWVC